MNRFERKQAWAQQIEVDNRLELHESIVVQIVTHLFPESDLEKSRLLVVRFVPLVIDHNPGYKS